MQDKRHEAVPDRSFVPFTGRGDVSTEAELRFDLNHPARIVDSCLKLPWGSAVTDV